MRIVVQNFDLSQITTALYVMQITAELSFALTPLFIRNASPPNKHTLQLHDTPILMRDDKGTRNIHTPDPRTGVGND